MELKTSQQVAFAQGVAAAFATILRVAGPSDHKAPLHVIAACKAMDLNYADFVAADVEDFDIRKLRPILDPGSLRRAIQSNNPEEHSLEHRTATARSADSGRCDADELLDVITSDRERGKPGALQEFRPTELVSVLRAMQELMLNKCATFGDDSGSRAEGQDEVRQSAKPVPDLLLNQDLPSARPGDVAFDEFGLSDDRVAATQLGSA
jgi:hypothetical protein